MNLLVTILNLITAVIDLATAILLMKLYQEQKK